MNDKVRAILLLPILLAAAATAYHGFYTVPSEGFSELAVLGPNMELNSYPSELSVGGTFNLYLAVGNHEGETTYYAVLIKLGDNSSLINESHPMNASIIGRYEQVLMDNETWIHPISLTINRAGVNLRLVFELWTYNQTASEFRYSGVWNQLWLNATAPGPI